MSDVVYNFIILMWKRGKVTEDDIYSLVNDNFMTEDEAQEIFNTERIINE